MLKRYEEASQPTTDDILYNKSSVIRALELASADVERLVKALQFFISDPQVDVTIGGNPHYASRKWAEIKATLAPFEGEEMGS